MAQLWQQMAPLLVPLCKHLLDRQNVGVRFVSAEPPLQRRSPPWFCLLLLVVAISHRHFRNCLVCVRHGWGPGHTRHASALHLSLKVSEGEA